MKHTRRQSLALIGAVAALPAGAWAAPPARQTTLPALLAAFQKLEGMTAHYVETKHIALMSEPLVNRGRVFYQRPLRFSRFVDEPFPSAAAVTGKQLKLWDGEQIQTLPLSANSAVASVVNAFLVLFRGDEKRLEAAFTSQFEHGVQGQWKLSLKPKAKELARLLSKLQFEGAGIQLGRMTLTEAAGDRSVTVFDQVKLNPKWSAQDQQRYLQLEF